MQKARTNKHRSLLVDAVAHMGTRVSHWMREAYPGGPKYAARDLDISPATAKHIFSGRLPSNRHMALLATKFGKRFLAFVYEPAVGPWKSIEFEARIEAAEKELAELRRGITDEAASLSFGFTDAAVPPLASRAQHVPGEALGSSVQKADA